MLRFCIAILLAMAVGSVEAAVRLETEVTEVRSGQVIEVVLRAEDLREIYGMDIALSYPAELVVPVDADPQRGGAQNQPTGIWGEHAFVAANRYEPHQGLHTLVLARTAPAEPLSGEGILWQGRFKARERGKATFKLERLEFGTRAGEKIRPKPVSDQVTVRILGAEEKSSGKASDSKESGLQISWLHLALAGAGLIIVVLLVLVWRLARR